MSLNRSQQKSIRQYLLVRSQLHKQLARVARANQSGDTSSTARKVALRRARSLAPQTRYAAKKVASLLPIVSEEVGAQSAEDARDLEALSAGESVVVIGADDVAWVEEIESLSPGWFQDRKNRQLVELGYSPYEIDPDLRIAAMLRSVGFGATGVAETTDSLARRIAKLRARLNHYRSERARVDAKLRSIPRTAKGAYSNLGQAERLQARLEELARRAARTRGEIQLLTAKIASAAASKTTAHRSAAIAQALVGPTTWGGAAVGVIVQQTADQVAAAKEKTLAEAAHLAYAAADAEQAAARVAELKVNALVAAEIAGGARPGSAKEKKALAAVKSNAAEAQRLEQILRGLAGSIQQRTQALATTFDQATKVVEAAAKDFAANTGMPPAKALAALLHEGEVTSTDVAGVIGGSSPSFGFAWGARPIPNKFRDRDGKWVYRTTESDAVWQARYEGAGHGAAAGGSGGGGGPSAGEVGQVVGDVVGGAMDLFSNIFKTFGPQQPPATGYPSGQPGYQPPPPEEPAKTNWTPILVAGGVALGVGALAAVALGGGGEANMLLSRDREGEFVSTRTAAPGYRDYVGQTRRMPSRDKQGRFVSSSRRAPSRA